MVTITEEEKQTLIKKWTAEQLAMNKKLIFEDHELSFSVTSAQEEDPRMQGMDGYDYISPVVWKEDLFDITLENLAYVGGLDISFVSEEALARGNGDEDPETRPDAYATCVVIHYPSMRVLHEVTKAIRLTHPYIPSFLAYREAPAYLELLDALKAKLKKENKEYEMPQVLLCDGNGRLHVREAGAACVVGLESGIPSIGVAKNYHPPLADTPAIKSRERTGGRYDWRRSQDGMKDTSQRVLKRPGSWFGVYGALPDTGSTYVGAALLPAKKVTNPIFVSPGHRLSLLTAIRLTLALCKTRVPEPTRLADMISRRKAGLRT